MPAILFALISCLGWGVGDVFSTIASRRLGGYSTAFWYIVIQFILSIPVGFFLWDQLQNLTISVVMICLILGVVGTGSLIAFYEGLRVGNSSLVGTISSSFAALVVIFSVIFLKERINSFQIFSISLIFLGILISSLNFKDLKDKTVLTDKGIRLALIAMFLWGIYWTFIKIPIQQIGWFWPGIIASTTIPIIPLFMKVRQMKLAHPSSNGALKPLLISTILLTLGVWSLYLAISQGLSAIVTPIAGSYPVVFVLLSSLVFKDPITRQQILGIITTLVGIVLLSVFGV